VPDHDDLTPDSIAAWPLRKGVTGYRVDEVDALLDRVADRIDQLEQQAARQAAELEDLRARADEASATEATLKRTLVMAQRAAEETVASAREQAAALVDHAQREVTELRTEATREADEVRSAARRDADEFRADAERARQEAELRVTRLRGIADRFRVQLQEHLDAHRDLLDSLPLADSAVVLDSGGAHAADTSSAPDREATPESGEGHSATEEGPANMASGGAGLFGVRRGPWASDDADEDDD
jgi:cell division initiation protein